MKSVSACNWKLSPTNQKHYSDLGSETPSVRNFSARSSNVISRGTQCWRGEKSAVNSVSRATFQTNEIDKNVNSTQVHAKCHTAPSTPNACNSTIGGKTGSGS